MVKVHEKRRVASIMGSLVEHFRIRREKSIVAKPIYFYRNRLAIFDQPKHEARFALYRWRPVARPFDAILSLQGEREEFVVSHDRSFTENRRSNRGSSGKVEG